MVNIGSDCWHTIFSYLSYKDKLNNCALVSRSWHHHIIHPASWKSLTYIFNRNDKGIVYFTEKLKPRLLEKIDITIYKYKHLVKLINPVLKNNHLIELIIKDCLEEEKNEIDYDEKTLCNSNNSLKSLSIRSRFINIYLCHIGILPQSLQNIFLYSELKTPNTVKQLLYLPNIENVELAGINIKDIKIDKSKVWPKLKTFKYTFSEEYQICETFLHTLLEHKSVESITLDQRIYEVFILTSYPLLLSNSLQTLNMACKCFSFESLVEKDNTTLKHMKIAMNYSKIDKLKYFKNLKTLALHWCNPKAICHIPNSLEALEFTCIYDTHDYFTKRDYSNLKYLRINLTDEKIGKPWNCPNLETLYIEEIFPELPQNFAFADRMKKLKNIKLYYEELDINLLFYLLKKLDINDNNYIYLIIVFSPISDLYQSQELCNILKQIKHLYFQPFSYPINGPRITYIQDQVQKIINKNAQVSRLDKKLDVFSIDYYK